MSRDILERTNDTFGADVELIRIALTMDQVEAYNPPPNPAKITDTRSKKYITQFGHESWELDALSQVVLNKLITDTVLKFRDDKLYQEVCQEEAQHKADLRLIQENYTEAIRYVKEKGL